MKRTYGILALTFGTMAGAASLGGCGGAATAPSRYPWDSCQFLGRDDVNQALGITESDGGVAVHPGATDFPWPVDTVDAAAPWSLKTAESRCEYRAAPGEDAPVVLAARLSGSNDRTLAGIDGLLASQGYPNASPVILQGVCISGARWTSLTFPGKTATDPSQTNGELHVLLSEPSGPLPGCPTGVDGSAAPYKPLYAYLVMFVSTKGSDGDATARELATGLMNAVVRAVRTTMRDIGREPLEIVDAQDAEVADGGEVPAPADASSVTFLDFPVVAGKALCDRLADCACSVEERAAGDLPLDSTCAPFAAASFALALTGAGQSIADGLLGYDAEVAATCLAGYRTRTCQLLRAGAPGIPCLSAFTPRSARGMACNTELDCGDDHCRTDRSDAGDPTDARLSASARCTARLPVGAECDSHPACASGNCAAGACAPPPDRSWCQGI